MSSTPCHVCGEQTDLCCSDCAIDLAAKVYVCSKRDCRVYHDTKCPGTREKPIDLREIGRLREASYEN